MAAVMRALALALVLPHAPASSATTLTNVSFFGDSITYTGVFGPADSDALFDPDTFYIPNGMGSARFLPLPPMMLLLTAGFGCPGSSAHDGNSEVRLAIDGLAVALRGDGAASAFTHSPYRRAVFSVRAGPLPTRISSRLFATLRHHDVLDGLRHCQRDTPYIEEGRPFRLRLERPGMPVEICAGLLHLAPAPLQKFIDDLQTLPSLLPELRAAHGYLRTEGIEAERLERIRESGRVALHSLKRLPSAASAVLAQAIDEPDEFHPLEPAQYDKLVPFFGEDLEIVVMDDGRGFQLALFRSASPDTHPSDEERDHAH